MQIEELGSVGLTNLFKEAFAQYTQPSTLLGIGDDAALLAPPEGEEVLLSSTLLMEGVHFDLVYVPLRYLGFKAVSQAVSNIVASGGTPRQLLLGLALSQRFQVEDVEEFMRGVQEAIALYKMDLVGGDTTSSYTGFAISATAVGSVKRGEMVRQSGAEEHQLICLTGDVGAAYMGLQLLAREKKAWEGSNHFAPKFEGREYLLQRQMHPVVRLDILEVLRQAGIKPSAMTDVTNGLASHLLQLCLSSGVGCRIYEEKIPIDYETHAMAEEMGFSELTAALHGGEDYELLFTVPLGMKDMLDKLEGQVHQIGFITAKENGCTLATRAGTSVTLTAQAFPNGI